MKKTIKVVSIALITILISAVLHGQTKYPFKFHKSLYELKKQKIHAGPIDTLESYQYPMDNKKYTLNGTLEHHGSADLSIPRANFIKDLLAYRDSLSTNHPNIFMVKDFYTGNTSGAIIYLKKNWFQRKRWIVVEVCWDGIISVPPGAKAFYTKLNDKSPIM